MSKVSSFYFGIFFSSAKIQKTSGITGCPLSSGTMASQVVKYVRSFSVSPLGFIHKCIQLYETTVVRHGLMLVGPTGSGKTKCYEVLQGASTSLKGVMSPAGTEFETTHTFVLNPKSITMGQLYGEFDLLTHEWYVVKFCWNFVNFL